MPDGGSRDVRTIANRATDPNQYDLQDISWLEEGSDARTLQFWAYLQKHAPIWRARRVLDIGCGHAWLMHNMSATGAQSVLGIEPSANNRTLARARYPDLIVHGSTFEAFMADPGSWDVLVAVMSLSHVGDIDDFFRKSYEMLAEDGQILAVVPDYDYFAKPRRQYKIKTERISNDQYAVEITRPSGTIADIVRKTSFYIEAAERVGMHCREEVPMPPAPEFLRLAPQFGDVAGQAITRLLHFQK
jgi:cyclopropane fatty-acyl-phospholipid synthase-like methyltransferase